MPERQHKDKGPNGKGKLPYFNPSEVREIRRRCSPGGDWNRYSYAGISHLMGGSAEEVAKVVRGEYPYERNDNMEFIQVGTNKQGPIMVPVPPSPPEPPPSTAVAAPAPELEPEPDNSKSTNRSRQPNITVEKALAVRQFARENLGSSIEAIAAKFDISARSVVRILKAGEQWSKLNALEAQASNHIRNIQIEQPPTPTSPPPDDKWAAVLALINPEDYGYVKQEKTLELEKAFAEVDTAFALLAEAIQTMKATYFDSQR